METFFFQFEKLSEGVPRILGNSLIPGNCHLTMLAFSRSHPGYDFYWQVEYDVVFQGSWDTLFASWHTIHPAKVTTEPCTSAPIVLGPLSISLCADET